MPMNDNDLLRFSRHILLPDVDVDGQQALLDATVLIVGVGGLGSPVAMYLAASGVGHLVLVDDDSVDISNLQRQIIHTSERVGTPKVESAATAIKALNPGVKVTCVNQRIPVDEWPKHMANVDVVIDCTDNFATRFSLNEACVRQRTPLVSGAAIRLEGQVTVFDHREPSAPCYRCLYEPTEEEDLNCAESGVLSPLVGVIGSLQALETVKLITGAGQTLNGRLVLFDAKYHQWRELDLLKDPQCPTCSIAAS